MLKGYEKGAGNMVGRYYLGSVAVLVVSWLFVSGCSNSSDLNGYQATVSDSDAVIVFQVGSEEDVTFLHRKHAEFWQQDCFLCHNHFDVRTDGAWKCGECHSNNDTENLCTDDANNHDCMAAQCYKCHLDPAIVPGPLPPSCSYCHMPINTGTFIDSPVQGLFYQTTTQSGITDGSGSFTYMAGETITFYAGTVLLGFANAKSIMSPLDLVPGAQITNQTVINIARFLQSIDNDQLPDVGGITIPANISTLTAGRAVDFNAVDGTAFRTADVLAIVQGISPSHLDLVDEVTAQSHLQSTLFPGIISVAPVTSGSAFPFTSSLISSTDIDTYSFALTQTMDVTIDVESWEAKDYTSSTNCAHTSPPCGGCHGSDISEIGPNTITGLTAGGCNDKLITNIYLFADDPMTGTLIGFKDCQLSGCGGADSCYPGYDHPDACVSRNEKNPHFDFTGLAPGIYYLKVGAAGLSLIDAMTDPDTPNNGDGSYYFTTGSGTRLTYYGDKYRVTFGFN